MSSMLIGVKHGVTIASSVSMLYSTQTPVGLNAPRIFTPVYSAPSNVSRRGAGNAAGAGGAMSSVQRVQVAGWAGAGGGPSGFPVLDGRGRVEDVHVGRRAGLWSVDLYTYTGVAVRVVSRTCADDLHVVHVDRDSSYHSESWPGAGVTSSLVGVAVGVSVTVDGTPFHEKTRLGSVYIYLDRGGANQQGQGDSRR